MKRIIAFTTVILFFTNCHSQQNCNCIEDAKYNNGLVATKVSIVKKEGVKYLKLHCASVMRLYYNNKDGKEVEKFQLSCISDKTMLLKFDKNFKYHNPNEETTIEKSQQQFIIKIKSNTENFYQINLNENKAIETISDFFIPTEN